MSDKGGAEVAPEDPVAQLRSIGPKTLREMDTDKAQACSCLE